MSLNDNLQDAEGKNNLEQSESKPIENKVEEVVSELVEESTTEPHLEVVRESNDESIEEIEASNAQDAEDESNEERHKLEEKDYHAMTMPQLNKEFGGLLKHHKIQNISKQVNEIRSEFKAKFEALLDEKKEEFVNDGGNEIDFYYSNDDRKLFNTYYKEYKNGINNYYQEREQSLKQNLQNRLTIIEEIKSLINVEENINTTYKNFKELQDKWRNAGPIPRDKYNHTWNISHNHDERFFDLFNLNIYMKVMDFKH